MLDNPLFSGYTSESHELESDWTSQIGSVPCARISSFTPLPFLQASESRANVEKRKRAGWSSRTKCETERMENKGDTDKKKEERKGGGKALFRQPDNLPSPEHIYGCPLTPSCCSLWRKSQCCWPACRFPIISLAEGSCLPIHQQVWTCRLWWSSISCYITTTQLWPQEENTMMHWSYLHVNSKITQQVWVVLLVQIFMQRGENRTLTVLRSIVRRYSCMVTLWQEWPYINPNTWAKAPSVSRAPASGHERGRCFLELDSESQSTLPCILPRAHKYRISWQSIIEFLKRFFLQFNLFQSIPCYEIVLENRTDQKYLSFKFRYWTENEKISFHFLFVLI